LYPKLKDTMELAIVKYIKEHGLSKALDDFKLKVRVYDKKLLIKYDQLESPFGNREVEECRGIVLEKDTWKVMCLGLTKFYNSAEGHAAKIDWSTARIQTKLDGTCINLYYDWYKECWFAATTGTAEGEGEVNNRFDTSFNDLFWETVKNNYDEVKFKSVLDYFKSELPVTLTFELTTPYNIVVTPHGESTITLLAARYLNTLDEVNLDMLLEFSNQLGVPYVEEHDLNYGNFDVLIKTFENMPFDNEGYVVVDGNFNRVKVKNPAYVAAHYLKGRSESHHILDIVKSNEIDEFIATFAERKEEILMLDENYQLLINRLENCWLQLKVVKPKNITKEERKKFASKVFDISESSDLKNFTGFFFGMMDGKIESASSYLRNMDNKKLYGFCKPKNG